MTLPELRAALIPFALALRADFDVPTQRAYHQVLKDVPAALLHAAVQEAEREPGLRFLPGAPEWRGRCEIERRRLLALHPWEPCADCEDFPGFRKVVVTGAAGPETRERCPCKARHLARMADLGVTPEPIAQLPAGRLELEEAELVDELPPAVTDRIAELAAQKRMG